MHGLIAQSNDSAWSFGGSILTFAFPMLLFIGVAIALYVLYTKPEVVPGRRVQSAQRPVSYTPIPGKPTDAPSGPPPAHENPAAAGGENAGGENARESENAEPEGGA